MAKPWDVSSDDIVQWSHKFDAPSVLPDLIRRLLLATTALSSITMNAHGGIWLGGPDGVVRSADDSPFCPAGVSIWELTVQGELGKLTDDFKKRTTETGFTDLAQTTYVAVSARRISGKLRWEADRRAEKAWKGVRLLGPDELAAWLATAPSVARWFAGQCGKPLADAEDLQSFLQTWCRRTRPPLPIETVLAGQERQQLAEHVRAWARSARSDGIPIRIFGDTWEEAAIFAAAALTIDSSPEGEQIRERTAILRSDEALRTVLGAQHAQPLLIIAAYPHAGATVGSVVIPMDGPIPAVSLGVLRLSPVPHRRFAELLPNIGVPIEEAARIAAESGGKLASLQRLLGYIELPDWAEGVTAGPLSALLLAGAFEPDNPKDREVLAHLGVEPREAGLLCERLRVVPDAPMHKEEGRAYSPVWVWRAPGDAWKSLVGQIPVNTLRRFSESVRLVLGGHDASFDPVPDAFPGDASVYASGSLRKGFANRSCGCHLAMKSLLRSMVRSEAALSPS